MTVAAYVPDLMDRSKVAAAVPDAAFVSSVAALADVDADVYLVDLGRPGVLDVVRLLHGRGRRVVGFAGHVHRDVLATARDAGCDARKRSDFFARVAEIVAG